jgi:23S rRNA (guanosine2251-2'-O)-methyltransferase
LKKKRLPPNRTIIYGAHPVLETLRAARRTVEEVLLARDPLPNWDLYSRLDAAGIPATRVSGDDLTSIALSPYHQGIAARVGPFPYADFDDTLRRLSARTGVVVILDEIQDPGNLGNILRSSECFGVDAVILTKDRSVPVTAAVEKASAGASAHVRMVRVVNLVRAMEQLKEASYWVYAADANAAHDCFSTDLTTSVAFVLGSEGKGLRRLVRERCDESIAVPMVGKIDSLNVSQTTAVLLAETLRQRSAAKDLGPGKRSALLTKSQCGS